MTGDAHPPVPVGSPHDAPGAELCFTVGGGVDDGLRFGLALGHCVMLGRAPLVGADASRRTGMLTEPSLERLHIEDHAAVERHVTMRNENGGGLSGYASFIRDVDVALADDAVSACHAMIFFDDAGASVLDLGSTNGTFVNGERTTSSALVVGDLVRLGETRLRLSKNPARR
jgi:hypothetical protein